MYKQKQILANLFTCHWFISLVTLLASSDARAELLHTQTPLQNIPDSLNPQLTNIIESNRITLYYNGSGNVPADNETSPTPVPVSPPISLNDTKVISDVLFAELVALLNNTQLIDDCARCMAATELLHVVALTQSVSATTNLLVRICEAFPSLRDDGDYAKNCTTDYAEPGKLGAYYAQVFSRMSQTTGDVEAWCAFQEEVCEKPPAIEIDESRYFSPKPPHAEQAPNPSGNTINVLHLSDWHLDSRYDVGSEANCTGHMCCRTYSENDGLRTNRQNASVLASRFGSFRCDAPPDLAISAFSEMHNFFDVKDIAFTIFTGDVVSHDNDNKLSQAYVKYEEEVTYQMFKMMLGHMPLYATLGNHDSMPRGYNIPHSLNPDPLNISSNDMSWNYNLLSSLWKKNSWLSDEEASFAATHYGAYATTTPQGLRIISLNSDFWFRANIFNYVNTSNPDPSGMLTWLASELAECEARGQRAWIIAHVLSGYSGSNAMPNPTALFYTIVRRFSPATIAGIFFGHTHLDQFHLFYDFLPNSTDVENPNLRNASLVDFSKPLQTAFIGPSITPLSGLNSGYRIYQVDKETFEVMGFQTYIANISNSLGWKRPVWQFEYDSRNEYSYDLYNGQITEVLKDGKDKSTFDSGIPDVQKAKQKDLRVQWSSSSPLNATFWHLVTESMLKQSENTTNTTEPPSDYFQLNSPDPVNASTPLFTKYKLFQSKSSSAPFHRGSNPDEISVGKQVCYLRAGSWGTGHVCKIQFPESTPPEDLDPGRGEPGRRNGNDHHDGGGGEKTTRRHGSGKGGDSSTSSSFSLAEKRFQSMKRRYVEEDSRHCGGNLRRGVLGDSWKRGY